MSLARVLESSLVWSLANLCACRTEIASPRRPLEGRKRWLVSQGFLARVQVTSYASLSMNGRRILCRADEGAPVAVTSMILIRNGYPM